MARTQSSASCGDHHVPTRRSRRQAEHGSDDFHPQEHRPDRPAREDLHEEFANADELMGWKKNWHPRGDKTAGPVKRGLGLSMHTWGGRGHNSDCDLTIHPDGSVEIKMGTQDLGTGTRTIILMVAADTLGIPMEPGQAAYRRQPLSGLRRLAAAAPRRAASPVPRVAPRSTR